MAERRAAFGEGARVNLAEVAQGKLVIRGNADDPAFRDGAAAAIGFALPTVPCTSAGGEPRALWLGPNEWLVVTAPGAEAELANALRGALAGAHAAVTEVSDARTVIGLAGPAAREVLAKGCPLDFHASAFAVGAVKQSLLAHVDVVIYLADESAFEVTVPRSFAAYLWLWLAAASAEYGLAESAS